MSGNSDAVVISLGGPTLIDSIYVLGWFWAPSRYISPELFEGPGEALATSIWGVFGVQFGTILGPIFDSFLGSTFERFWDPRGEPRGPIWGPFWAHFGDKNDPEMAPETGPGKGVLRGTASSEELL